MMQSANMNISSVHITTFQDKTWGRVFVQYEQQEQHLYAFKNFLDFKEVNYVGNGELLNEPAYSWFNEGNRYIFTLEEVLSGKADHLFLTPSKWKNQYGTPSVLLKRLLIDIYSENLTPVEHRRGWFNNFFSPQIELSEIHITKDYNQIVLDKYATELNFEPLMKTLYVFFLKHPEGVKKTYLVDFKSEIETIYKQISQKSDLEKVQQSLEKMISGDGKSFDEKISKIKKYLIDLLGEKLAHIYFVSKTESDTYAISLPVEKIKFD